MDQGSILRAQISPEKLFTVKRTYYPNCRVIDILSEADIEPHTTRGYTPASHKLSAPQLAATK